ncbi:MFS transporter [Sphingobium scionense]
MIEGKARKIRWAILAMLFASTVINYLDRQALSILATTVQRDLHMDDIAYARVVQAFLIAYTFAYLMAGRVTDWLGTRLSLALFVGWWSLANLLTGFVRSAGSWARRASRWGSGKPAIIPPAPRRCRNISRPRNAALRLASIR